jgi:hypothetical protein
VSISEIRTVKLEELTVDPKVQRQLDQSRVRKLARDWDRDMEGVLTVSLREWEATPGDSGESFGQSELVVLDGQTRMEAARIAGVTALRAEVFEGLSEAQEAAIFLKHNDRKAVTPRDRFRLSVVALDEKALTIRDIAADHGWFLQGMPQPEKGFRMFSAISAAEKVYDYDGGKALRRAFDVIDRAWGRAPGVVCSESVYGLGQLFGENPTGLDAAGLVHKLGKLGFNTYVSAISDRRRTHPGTSIRSASLEWTVELYNRGRRNHRI